MNRGTCHEVRLKRETLDEPVKFTSESLCYPYSNHESVLENIITAYDLYHDLSSYHNPCEMDEIFKYFVDEENVYPISDYEKMAFKINDKRFEHHLGIYNDFETVFKDVVTQFYNHSKEKIEIEFMVKNMSRPNIITSYFFPKKKETKIFWVTVNPKPDVEFETFRRIVDRYTKREICKNVVYTYEQRGTSDATCGQGFHVHIMFDKNSNYSPKQCERDAYNTFKHVVGSDKKHVSNYVNVKVYPSSYREDKVAYLKGLKDDPSKDASVSFNKVFRDKYGLLDIYTVS